MKGGVGPADYSVGKSLSQAESIFVGNICKTGAEGSVVEVRNKIHSGDVLEILMPDGSIGTVAMPTPLETIEGEYLDFANNSQFIKLPVCVGIVHPTFLPEYTVLRRVEKSS